jgi:predicted nucleotidyltransferase
MLLYPHHQRTVDRLIDRFKDDANTLALIIGGSLVKGYGNESSDVDFVLIATTDEYARREATRALTYYATDLSDYPGGYVDGKIVNVAFLEEVADRGSEPARSAFENVIVAYSQLPQLADLLHCITAYPEAHHVEKIRSFYAQLLAMQWYVGEAEKHNNCYLMMHTVSDLVLFGGRLILAHNRMLYPYHKWFLRTLQDAPAKPDDLMTLIDHLLNEPNKANADRLCEAILNFTAWPTPPEGWPARFMEDTEWAWRTGSAAIADW